MKKIRQRIEDLPIPSDEVLASISKTLAKQIDEEEFRKKYAGVASVLKLIGAGVFVAASLALPNAPKALKGFNHDTNSFEAWKRFNIPYLKRTLARLEKQRLIEVTEENGMQTVKITQAGKRRVLKYALDELEIKKPKNWDGHWYLVSYDLPKSYRSIREIFRDYLRVWGFYPIHKSVYLHAYPCIKEVSFLRDYLGIGEHVRLFKLNSIEYDKEFREFFGV